MKYICDVCGYEYDEMLDSLIINDHSYSFDYLVKDAIFNKIKEAIEKYWRRNKEAYRTNNNQY